MSMKMMKKAIVSTVGAAALAGTMVAHATVSPAAPQTRTFEGLSDLTIFGFIQADDCVLSLTGDVTENGSGDVTVTVTEGSVTQGALGDAACNQVDLNLDPNDSSTHWTASLPNAQLPNPRIGDTVNGTFTNLNITASGISCGGSSIVATFSNGASIGDESTFSFNGSVGACTVNGTLEVQGSDIDAFL